MCGISGYSSSIDLSEELNNSLSAIKHRGPDADGRYNQYSPGIGCYVGIGHVRLSILDISPEADQPMISPDGKILMVFNGEIYNHELLRTSYLSGETFHTRSDSEVLLRLYCNNGLDCLIRLEGMFSVAFLHIDTGKIVLARDQMGIKPLYYHHSERGLKFSSEIKGLMSYPDIDVKVSEDDLFEFLSAGYVLEPNTGYESIKKVPAGGYVVVEGVSISKHAYFSLNESITSASDFSFRDVIRSVRMQLQSDVPLGVFFSGGLDSTAIASEANTRALFLRYSSGEIATSGANDDLPYAEEIANILEIELDVLSLSSKIEDDEFLSQIRMVAQGTEELISDFTYISSFNLSKEARQRGYKVMLSGMGGDETFAGYPRYKLLEHYGIYKILYYLTRPKFIARVLRRIPSLSKKLERFYNFFSQPDFLQSYFKLVGYFSDQEIEGLWNLGSVDQQRLAFRERCSEMVAGHEDGSRLLKAMLLDYYGFLSHNLTVTDKASMANGLEVRVPLLNEKLYVDHLSYIRSNREDKHFGKKPLAKILATKLPSRLIDRPKAGFNPPLDRKINKLGREAILEDLEAGKIFDYLKCDAVVLLVDEHFSKRANNTYKIWQLLYLNSWLSNAHFN